MDQLTSTISNWFDNWPDFATSPPVIFVAGIINSYTSVVLAIPSILAIAQAFRMRTRSVTLKTLTNVLVSVLLVVAVLWSGFSYLHNDNRAAIRVGIGAIALSILMKGVPWLWYRLGKREEAGKR